MEEKKMDKKKIFRLTEILICVAIILVFAALVIVEIVSPNSSVGEWVSDNLVNTDNVKSRFKTHLPTLIRSIAYIVIIFTVCTLVRMIFQHQMKKSNRAKTVLTLLDGLVKYGCAIALIIYILQAVGINSTAIFASVGILTLVIGLGCQSLIADVVAGMFIIFENEYTIGEIVSIGDFRGTVVEIGIRTTRLLDLAGNIKIINNSNISNVINMSRELSLATVDCEFPYDVPVVFVEGLLKDNLENFKNKIPAIIEGPFYKGVSGYGDSNVAVKLVAKCKEEDRYQVQRDLLREYRMVFTEAGIDLSFNQVVISQAEPTNYHTTKKMEKDAQAFVDEQKELAKTMDSEENA